MKKNQTAKSDKAKVPVFPAGTRDEIDRAGVLMQRDGSKPLSPDNVVPVMAELARMRGDLTTRAFVDLCCKIADHQRQISAAPRPSDGTALERPRTTSDSADQVSNAHVDTDRLTQTDNPTDQT